MNLTSGILWLALNVYFEARGEPYEGKKAVVHVVLNRVEKRSKPIKDIITESKQFSWYNGGKIPEIKDFDAFLECYEAVMDVITNERFQGMDFNGADHYHSDSVDPYWDDNMQFISQIGRHKFYKS